MSAVSVTPRAARAQANTLADTTRPAPPARVIDLQAAIVIALEQSVGVKQSANTVTASAAVASTKRDGLLPSLSLSSTGTRSLGSSSSTLGAGQSSSSTLSTGLSSSLVLFDGWRNLRELRQARLDVAANTSDLLRARQTAVFSVASDYLTLTTAVGQLNVQRQNLTAQEAEESQLRKLVNAGARSISGLYQQQATTENARANVLSAERDVALARMGLIQLLQLDPEGSYDFVLPMVPDVSGSVPPFQLDSLLAHGYASRPDLRAAQSRVASAAQGSRAAAAGRLPSVSATVGYTVNQYSSTAAAATVGGQSSQSRGGSLSLGLTLPLFDRGATNGALQQAQVQEDNARLALSTQRQAVALEIRRAYLDYQSTRQQLIVAYAQRKAADLAVSTTRQRYQLGASTLLELTQALASQLQAATLVVSARNTLAFERAIMSYYTGDLDPGRFNLGP